VRSVQVMADRLISIYVSWEWQCITIRKRWIQNGCVQCERATKQLDVDAVERTHVYEVCVPEAIAMFSNLYRQAAEGFTYDGRSSWAGSSDQQGVYMLSLGSRQGITINEGGEYESLILMVDKWFLQEIDGEESYDRDMAYGYFDRHVFASFAVYVDLGLDYFDRLCEIAYTSDGPWSENK